MFTLLTTNSYFLSCLDFIEDLQDSVDSCHSVINMADEWIFNGRLEYRGTTHCNITTIIIKNDYSSSHSIMFYFTHTADDDGVLSNCSDKLQVMDGDVQDKPSVGKILFKTS